MGKQTALIDEHIAAGAKLVDFAGWDMPVDYGSQLAEHRQVRNDAGMFDVSHMRVVDVSGAEAKDYLQRLLANDVAKLSGPGLAPGKALYSCLLNADAGVIDDLIVYRLDDQQYRLVVNAGTAEKDINWMREQAAGYEVSIDPKALALIAVQGPQAREKALPELPEDLQAAAAKLKPFHACWNEHWFIGRTGYTGEDGFEVMLPNDAAVGFWQALNAAGVAPIGLGARDTLRLEAGMNLYGADMDEQATPLESGLGWTIAWAPEERNFIGREHLQAQKAAGVSEKLVGLVLLGRGVLRDQQKVVTSAGDGVITSGSFSPNMEKAIALARVPVAAEGEVAVEMRGRQCPAKIVKPPFVRHGKVLIAIDD